jgi:hypothetical protein
VDADRFPEDEFPVYCPKCDYLLRGLRDERCPECGTPFDRGRLLVQQYVHEWNRRALKKMGEDKWLRRFLVFAAVAVVITFVVPTLAAFIAYWSIQHLGSQAGATSNVMERILHWSYGMTRASRYLQLLVAVFLGGWAFWGIRLNRASAGARRRVLDAIEGQEEGRKDSAE